MAVKHCNVQISQIKREIKEHGTVDFPVGLYYDNLPFDDVPWHWHDHLEIGYVYRGAFNLGVDSEKIVLHEGECFFINREILHSCWCENGETSILHSIVFSTDIIGKQDSIFYTKYVKLITENKELPYYIFKSDVRWQQDIIKKVRDILKCAEKEELGFEFEIRNDLSQIILSIVKHLPVKKRELSEKALRTERRMKTMLQYISENLGNDLKTKDIAGSAMISESECVRCFQDRVGMPPIRYVKQLRIQNAAEMLLDSERSVGDIAIDCGFLDMSYFTKTFKDLKGNTPSEYRRLGRNKK